VEIVMAELLSFIHTGKLTTFDFDKLKVDGQVPDMRRYIRHYLHIFDAAVKYDVNNLPQVIETLIKQDITWTPGVDDLHLDAADPPLKELISNVYEIKERFGEKATRLKKIFLQKWARDISNISGKDYTRGDSEDNDNDPVPHLDDLQWTYDDFHEDLGEALELVKQDDEEVYEASEGDCLPHWRIRRRPWGLMLRPRSSKL
jgi:hypothetical protein